MDNVSPEGELNLLILPSQVLYNLLLQLRMPDFSEGLDDLSDHINGEEQMGEARSEHLALIANIIYG